MSGCQVTTSPCGAQPAAEVRAVRDGRATPWKPACCQHAADFEAFLEANGYGFEHRPPAVLRDVLEHAGDANVIPITRAERAS